VHANAANCSFPARAEIALAGETAAAQDEGGGVEAERHFILAADVIARLGAAIWKKQDSIFSSLIAL
jgi:hypothetical protein